MKKLILILTIFPLMVGFTPIDDFTRDLMLYWSFNNVEAAPAFFRSHIHARGYSGSSLELKGIGFPVKLETPVRLRKRFSINFWFKPENVNTNKPIIVFRDKMHSGIEFGMRNQTIYCRIGGHTEEHYPFMILDTDWTLASLSYDGLSFHLTLFSSQVTSTTHFAVSSFKSPCEISELEIAPGKDTFRGFIDEIMIYEKEIKAIELEKMYEGKLPDEEVAEKPKKEPVSKPKFTVSPEAEKKLLASEAEKSKRFIMGQAVVNEKNLILEVENWGDLKTKCDVKLNDEVVIKGANDPTGVAMIGLETNESNVLSFAVPSTAQPEQIKLKLMDGADEVDKFELTTRTDGEVALSLTHRSVGQPITEVQKTMTVSQRVLKIEVWDDKLTDGDFVSVYCNDEKVIDYQEVTKEKIVVELVVDLKKNNLISFVAEDSGKYGNNSAKVRILENGRVVDEFRFTSTYRKKAGLLIRVQEKNK